MQRVHYSSAVVGFVYGVAFLGAVLCALWAAYDAGWRVTRVSPQQHYVVPVYTPRTDNGEAENTACVCIPCRCEPKCSCKSPRRP